jgi:cobalt-zinc-cadmium efflux system outer membrane protein
MFRIGSTFTFCLSLGLAPVPVVAAPAPDPAPLRLTLDAALARAEAASPLVRRARAARDAALAREVGASLLFPSNPIVSGALGPVRDGDGRGLGVRLHAEQTIEVAGQRGTRRRVVAAAVRVAELREAVARAETHARVRAAYVGAQLARAQVDAAHAREVLVEKLLSAVEARAAAGAASDVDLAQARLERGAARGARVDATLAAAEALSRLRPLIGLPAARAIVLDERLAAPVAPPGDLATLLARAEERRTELAVLGAQKDEIDADLDRLRREAIPSPTLFVELERDLPGQLLAVGGVGLPLPTWRRGQGEIALAQAERRRIDDERELVARDVAAEVERAYQTEEAAREMSEVLDREVLPAATQAIALMTEGWQAGKFDLFRLLQTSRDASEARRLYLETLGKFWTATIDLDRAVGRL